MSSPRSVLLLCGVCLWSSACRQALGIEDAEVDPSLSHSSKGGSAGSMTGLATGGAGSAGAGADGGEGGAAADNAG